jgi:zinc protease
MTPRRVSFAAIAAAAAAIAFVAGSSLFARQGAAPQTPPKQAVVMKGRAPVSTEVLKLRLPRPTEGELASGAHLMVLEDRRAPQVTFQVLIPGAGGYFDPADTPGLASITAAMMREGTTSRTTLQISEQLERMAASVGVGSGLSSLDATVSGSSLTDNLADTFGLAVDILLNPTFPDDELGRYKARTRSGLVQQRTSPNFLANEMFSKVIYGTHPAARTSFSPATLDKITRAMLADFHKAHYVPDHALIAFSGDISMAEARTLVETKLAAWKKSAAPVVAAQDPPGAGPGKIYFIARPNSVQTTFVVGTEGISRTAPDYDLLSVTNQVLGGGPTGRLFTILREEKGYTYGAYSGLSALRFRGNWSASMDVRTEVTEASLRDLLAEIGRMRDEAVPAKEFQDKKRGMVASFALGLESPQQVLNYAVQSWIYKLPADYWDKYPERIGAITEAQVQAEAKRYFDAGRLHIVIVGDPKIGEMLKKFGPVTTYDTNGNIVGGS